MGMKKYLLYLFVCFVSLFALLHFFQPKETNLFTGEICDYFSFNSTKNGNGTIIMKYKDFVIDKSIYIHYGENNPKICFELPQKYIFEFLENKTNQIILNYSVVSGNETISNGVKTIENNIVYFSFLNLKTISILLLCFLVYYALYFIYKKAVEFLNMNKFISDKKIIPKSYLNLAKSIILFSFFPIVALISLLVFHTFMYAQIYVIFVCLIIFYHVVKASLDAIF